MAHHSKFLSVNLNKSYGKPSSSISSYGNGLPRSAGGAGGMVVLSRPRSSSGAAAHKSASKLAVPPPVNLPSLRKEHERLDPTSSKPSSGYGGSGLGAGNGPSMGWTKPGLSSGEQQSIADDARPQVFTEKAVILKGEDFPSLLATSASSLKQKQRQISEKSDWEEKPGLSSIRDMRPQMRSSSLGKSNLRGGEDGSIRIPYPAGQSRQEDANFRAPLPLVRLRHTPDWDDDERDRNYGVSASDDHDGRLLLDGEGHSLSRDSGRVDLHRREFMNSKKVDRDVDSWRVTVQPNSDFSMLRQKNVDKDQVGRRNSSVNRRTNQENVLAGLFKGDKRDFGSVVGICNVKVAEALNDRAEVSNSWQRGKSFSSGMISKAPAPSGFKNFLLKDSVMNFSKEKARSNAHKSYAEGVDWSGKGLLSSDAMLDLNAKVFRKKKEEMDPFDYFDPVRESFEAEIERVQQMQELERQRMMEEQARAMEVTHREVEERERRVREEEERKRLLEEEAREAAWRAEQEKLEAARRIEEQRIAIKEEKKRILMEEERRKEAARQKLLELEARIAKRQTVANTMDDRMKERDLSRDLNQLEWEKTERMVEPFSNSSLSDSSYSNRLPDAGFTAYSSNVETYTFAQRGRPESNWCQNNNSKFKFQDQDGTFSSSRHDTFCSKRDLHGKQLQGRDAPMSLAPSFRKEMSANLTVTEQSWDRNNDCDQFNQSSIIEATFGAWDHGHFSGSQLASYSQPSFDNTEVEDLVSSSRVRHTLRLPRVPPPPSLSSLWLKNTLGATSEGPNSPLSVSSDARSYPTGSKEESDLQIVFKCRYQQVNQEPGTSELLEGTDSSLLRTEDNSSPRYDSQSSLSVSSPPSSPTQHSHDELDDCGGSPALTTSVEEDNITFSDSKPMMHELDAKQVNSETTPFCHEEDDEWAVDINEEMQKGDHDEVHDNNQEDNEDHEGDTGKLLMADKLDNVDAVVGETDEGMRNSSFGVIVCSQLGASVHDFLNKDFGTAEKTSINQGSLSSGTTELVFADNCADILQSKEAFTDEIINTLSEGKIDERKEDVILCPITSADQPPDSIEASKMLGQLPMESATNLPLSSSSCSVSASIPTSTDEVSVRFQFGLFSGPPLIPSPLPTIQIGSFQMPLPLHDSYGQIHASHPPLCKFYQRNQYTPPISQGALPIAGQTLPFMHSFALGHDYIKQNPGSSSSNHIIQSSTPRKILGKEQLYIRADKDPGFASEIANQCLQNSDSEQLTTLLDAPRDKDPKSECQITSAASDEKKDVHNLFSPSANPDGASNKNYRFMLDFKRVQVSPHAESLSLNRKSEVASKAPETIPEIRGNRFSYNARNTGCLPSLRRMESLFANSYQHRRRGRRHFQGNEYRVKENGGTRQMHHPEFFKLCKQNEKPNYINIATGVSSRNLGRKDPVFSKSAKLTAEEATPATQVVGADSNMSGANKNEFLMKLGVNTGDYCGGEGILKKNGILKDGIGAPLQSGIVRIFNQPGIEASADGDGFVEVRSKRKVSNERRMRREKETKPKYKAVKVPQRPCPAVSNNTITSRSDIVATLPGGAAAKRAHSNPFIAIRRSQAALEASLEASLLATTGMEDPTIPPIRNPVMDFTNFEANLESLNSIQVGSAAVKASDGAKLMPSLSFGDNIIEKASVPLGSWDTVHLDHQVLTSTISQLDEASNPIESNLCAADKISLDDSNRGTSTMTHEKPFFSSANQLNFPFTGQKIQFGAVALPSTLPTSNQFVASGLWPPGSGILNPSINVPVNDHSQSSFFDKEKCSGVPCTHLDDTEAEAEAEAEAAASAVAVAAISNDEISVCTVGSGSTSDNVTKGLNVPGVTRFANVAGQSASEESLAVTLPADLSVDTPHSLWLPLPSIQCSRQILSHITGPHPSPFPFFDQNPLLGGAIFPFSPQDEFTWPQAQTQQNATFGSVPTGTWSQCHSSVDSFYGSPAGFPAPFMSAPGVLSGVHPQMVFYNHFAPLGQFSQVGLSYMDTTLMPTGKQPDWKHNSEASTMNVNKADPSNPNVVYGHQKVANVLSPAQHLSSGSSVNPVNSPFPIFNLRTFQSPTETSVPGHWPPIPHPSLHSIQLSSAPEQLQSLPLDASSTKVGSNVPHSTAADLPDELGLLESPAPNSADAKTIQPSRKPAAINSIKDLNEKPSSANSIVSHSKDSSRIGIISSAGNQNMITQQIISPTVQQQRISIRESDQPKGAALKASSGSSELRRRNTFRGKIRNISSDKNIGSTKMKQIYVAKSPSAAHTMSS